MFCNFQYLGGPADRQMLVVAGEEPGPIPGGASGWPCAAFMQGSATSLPSAESDRRCVYRAVIGLARKPEHGTSASTVGALSRNLALPLVQLVEAPADGATDMTPIWG
ncbi:hypothetical protein K426_09990 [Sphingobium sp. TKS]|nr:hypothetical protein K426_09990 [Sphingobium sp. TKS]